MSQFRPEKDTLSLREVTLETTAEQSVELDFQLPDYYPDIFKILKTRIIPVIRSRTVSDDRLSVDGVFEITVWYCPENGKEPVAIHQNVPFLKTVDLPAGLQGPSFEATARCYFENGRAVTPRRVEVRGGASFRITAEQDKKLPVVLGASGGGVQLSCSEETLLSAVKRGEKHFHVTEEIPLPDRSGKYRSLLYRRCQLAMGEGRAISGRVVCKGELLFHLLYAAEDGTPARFDHSIPISQIVDLEGVNEGDEVFLWGEVTGISCEEKPGSEGMVLFCEFTASIYCRTEKNESFLKADDAFSTRYETELQRQQLSALRLGYRENRTLSPRFLLETGEPVAEVFDVMVSFGEGEIRRENGNAAFLFDVTVSAVGTGENGSPFFIEKTFPAELELKGENPVFSPQLLMPSVSFTIFGGSGVEVRPEILVSGTVYERFVTDLITDIKLDTDAPKPRPVPALRIYRGEEGETVWEIAKRYGTSVSALMEENDLEQETLPENCTLLIPMVG